MTGPAVRSPRRVAVLGAGIMGTTTALYLARRGLAVTLIDAAGAPLSGASRWNEGKIHLGYLYAADPSLDTARRLIPGGLAFADRMRELVGVGPAEAGARDDIYLIHRDSIVGADAANRYFDAVSALVRNHPGAARYLADVSQAEAHPMTRAELEAVADPELIVAGFRVPERSVRTSVIADALVDAVRAEPGIALAISTRVSAVAAADASNSAWRVATTPMVGGTFDLVVNALWDGRLAIDGTAGLAPESPWSHRYRVSLFVETVRPVAFPSVVVATGPFGDVKNYDNRHFYISWYPAGLLVDSHDVTPARPAALDAEGTARIVAAVREGIMTVLPGAVAIFAAAGAVRVEGGWVFAHGQGSLGDPAASLHRRDRFGIRRLGTYLSVDTGKYSTAPWLAWRLAAEVAGQ